MAVRASTIAKRQNARKPRAAIGLIWADPAAMLGLIAAFGFILTAIHLGGTPETFIDLPSILIVIGGTAAVTVTSFPLTVLANLPATLMRALSPRRQLAPSETAREALSVAQIARQQDPAKMEQRIRNIQRQPLLIQGLQMLIDAAEIDVVDTILRREARAFAAREEQAEGLLRRAADVAPAMGLIGTLIGLVQMLGRLDDPSMIGPAMAVALLTTFYGAVLAHGFFTPLAERLARQAEINAINAELQCIAVRSIAYRENPRRLETALNALLPPQDRLAVLG